MPRKRKDDPPITSAPWDDSDQDATPSISGQNTAQGSGASDKVIGVSTSNQSTVNTDTVDSIDSTPYTPRKAGKPKGAKDYYKQGYIDNGWGAHKPLTTNRGFLDKDYARNCELLCRLSTLGVTDADCIKLVFPYDNFPRGERGEIDLQYLNNRAQDMLRSCGGLVTARIGYLRENSGIPPDMTRDGLIKSLVDRMPRMKADRDYIAACQVILRAQGWEAAQQFNLNVTSDPLKELAQEIERRIAGDAVKSIEVIDIKQITQ